MRAVAGVLLLVCAGCAQIPPPDPSRQIPALEGRIFTLINVERHALDPSAKELALDPELVSVARARSAGMAAKNKFADDDPHISATRLMAADAKFQGLLGENVAAQRYSRKTGIDVDRSAQSFVAMWVSSPSHKDNLSFADYARTARERVLRWDLVLDRASDAAAIYISWENALFAAARQRLEAELHVGKLTVTAGLVLVA